MMLTAEYAIGKWLLSLGEKRGRPKKETRVSFLKQHEITKDQSKKWQAISRPRGTSSFTHPTFKIIAFLFIFSNSCKHSILGSRDPS